MNEEKRMAVRTSLPVASGGEEDAPLSVKGSPDIPMLLLTVILILFGCVMVYSASAVYAEQYHHDSTYFIVRHLIFALIGAAAMFLIIRFCTPVFWQDFAVILFAISILLLLAVLVIGDDLGSGAKRWLNFGFITLQPSEVAKLALVMILAKYMTTYRDKVRSEYRFGGSFLYGVVYPGMIIAAVAGLIALERHISGLMIVGMLGISVMFLGGTKVRWIAAIGGAVIAAGCVLVLVSSYAQARVDTWLHIDRADPLGAAWQTLQGLMAIGSGGLFGTGLGFTIVCEELGFFGAFIVVALFVMFVWRGFYIARHTTDAFSALVVYGLTFKVGLQVALNIAVVTNSMPNTGISLPFFSYGGTSLVLQMIEVAIILSISRYATHRKI